MHLEVLCNHFVQEALLVRAETPADRREGTTHRDVVGLELRDHVLPQASGAKAHAVAEVADPAAIVLAHVEVVIVVELEARVAELPVALILWFLRQLDVPLQVCVLRLLRVELEELWHKDLEALCEQVARRVMALRMQHIRTTHLLEHEVG